MSYCKFKLRKIALPTYSMKQERGLTFFVLWLISKMLGTEIQKMLGIQYKAPHLPIEMSIGDRNQLAQEFLVNDRYHSPENDYRAEEAGIKRSESGDLIERSNNQISSGSNQQGEMFRSLAQTKYNIRV